MRLACVPMVAVLLSCGGDDGAKKAKYGLTERIDNTSCVVETVSGDTVSVAPTLSATGCYSDLAAKVPNGGLVAFDINVALWTDGTHKRRFMGIPAGTVIGFTETGAWDFPIGTIFMKEFWLDMVVGDASSRRLIETRFFVRAAVDVWRGYSYRWNDEGTDGELLTSGETVEYEVTEDGNSVVHPHDFPSRAQCLRCHPVKVGSALGLQTPQMNRTFDYDGVVDNQLRALNHVGYFDRDIEGELDTFTALPSPEDTSRSLETRARAIMHANCSHCHQPDGSAVSAQTRDLRYETPLAETYACDQLSAGNPAASSLWQRIAAVEMPPIAVHTLDPRLDVVREWIASMSSCP